MPASVSPEKFSNDVIADTLETLLTMGIHATDTERLLRWHRDIAATPRSELTLPWPKRMENSSHETMTRCFLPQRLMQWIADRTAEGCSVEKATMLLDRLGERSKSWQAVNREAFGAAMAWGLYKHSPSATIMTISKDLIGMMAMVDIDDKMPVQYLASPFEACYLEFGSQPDRMSGINFLPPGVVMGWKTAIEGAFINFRQGKAATEMSPGYREHMGWSADDDIKCLDIRFFESPLAATNPNAVNVCNDMHFRLSIPWRDDETEFGQQFEKVVSWYSEFNAELMGDVKWLRDLSGLVAKLLLLLHTKQANLVPYRDADNALAKIGRIGGEHKRRKAMQRARTAYNHIRIDLDMAQDWMAGSTAMLGAGGKVATHWRRGHFHTYWVGKGRTERLVRLLPPVLVNAELSKTTPKAKEYKLEP